MIVNAGEERNSAREVDPADGHQPFPLLPPQGVSIFKLRGDDDRARWRIKFVDPRTGKRRVRRASPDAALTRQIAIDLLQACAAGGTALQNSLASRKPGRPSKAPPAAIASPEQAQADDPMKQRFALHRLRPIAEHVADYRAILETKGKLKHVRDAIHRVEVMLALCAASTWADLQWQPSLILLAREQLREKKLGAATINHHVNALKGFARWMAEDFRADFYPYRGIKSLSRRRDVRHGRRPFTETELKSLIDAANTAQPMGDVSGPERAMCYILAAHTGLRANEMRSLTMANFTFGENPKMQLSGEYTKNGEPVDMPLRADIAAMIESYFRSRVHTLKPFRVPMNSARALRKDLAAAGVAYVVDGKFGDFHALRHTFISSVVKSGVNMKLAQTLARHLDPRMTLSIYSHVSLEEQRTALEAMPAVITTDAAAAMPAFNISI